MSLQHRVYSTLLASTVSLSLLATAPLADAQQQRYTDINNHWARTSIERLSGQNIISGYQDNTFRPENPISRAEFSALMKGAFQLQAQQSGADSRFRDVNANYWAQPAIQAAVANNLMTGYPNNFFFPERNISLAEAAAVVVNAGRVPVVSEAEAQDILGRYTHFSNIPQWSQRHVATALKYDLVPQAQQVRHNFQQPASRGTVASMLDSLLEGNRQTQFGQRSNSNTMVGQTGAENGQQRPTAGGPYRGTVQEVVIPQETVLAAQAAQRISSETAQIGDTVVLNLPENYADSQGRVLLPAGSRIEGQVTQVERAGRAEKGARLAIAFGRLILPDGTSQPLNARIATQTDLQGATTKERVLKTVGKTALGAGLGAALGTAMGPLSGGEVGKGAIYGTAIGAGLGATTAILSKGDAVVIEQGQPVLLQLQEKVIVPSSLATDR